MAAAVLVLQALATQRGAARRGAQQEAEPAGIHFARRHTRSIPGPCLPYRDTARRTRSVTQEAQESLKDTPRHYLNRLSDLMLVLSRVLNRYCTDASVGDDVYWRSQRLAQAAQA